MRDTISSGIGSLLSVMASHARSSITFGADAPSHLISTRIQSGVRTDSGEERIIEIQGRPEESRICTSYVERNNLTIRMQLRRFTRLTNGFSKKLANLRAMVALFLAYYNFCRIHGSLRVTPAMAAGITDRVWELLELVA